MCIAIYKPESKTITEDVLRLCYKNNPHGAGFAFADGERVHIRKGYFSFTGFMKVYERYKDMPMVIHFRYATVGRKSKANCHPFRLNEKMAIVHNGTLHQYQPMMRGESDSRHFARNILKPALDDNPDFDLNEHSAEIAPSRMIVFRSDAQAQIINERLGEWAGSVWFSNTYYRETRRQVQARRIAFSCEGLSLNKKIA